MLLSHCPDVTWDKYLTSFFTCKYYFPSPIVTVILHCQLDKIRNHHGNKSLGFFYEGFFRLSRKTHPKCRQHYSIGHGATWKKRGWGSQKAAFIFLCFLTMDTHDELPAAPAFHTFPALTDCIPMNCEPRQILLPLNCLYQVFGLSNETRN